RALAVRAAQTVRAAPRADRDDRGAPADRARRLQRLPAALEPARALAVARGDAAARHLPVALAVAAARPDLVQRAAQAGHGRDVERRGARLGPSAARREPPPRNARGAAGRPVSRNLVETRGVWHSACY